MARRSVTSKKPKPNKTRWTVPRVEAAAQDFANGIELDDETFIMVMLHTCSKCLRAFKSGQRLGQLPMIEGGPMRWHKRCPKK